MKALTPLSSTPTRNGAHTGARRGTTLHFEARDVTGTHVLEARNVQPATPARAVAAALASRMALPQNVPWILRDAATGGVLDDETPVGDQIESGAKVVLSPKAHLG